MTEPEEIFARCQVLLGAGGKLRGPARARLRGRDARAARRRPLSRQPLLRSDGRRPRRGGPPPRAPSVTLLAANLGVPVPRGIDVVQTPTAADMRTRGRERARDADVVVMAAAVADYRPAEPIDGKRPKERARAGASSSSRPSTSSASSARPAATGRCSSASPPTPARPASARAREKLATKGADLIVFNDVARDGIGFDAADNEVVLDLEPRRARRSARPQGSDRRGRPRRGRRPPGVIRRS